VFAALLLSLIPGQYTESKDFPRDKQRASLEATVGLFQPASREEGTAVFVGYKNGVAFLLTANHIVKPVPDGDRLRLELFTDKSYPKVHQAIETALLRARMPNEDLALVVAPLKEPPPNVLRICPPGKLPRRERFPFPALTVGCDDALGRPRNLVDTVRGRKLVKKPDGSAAVYWECERPQARGRSGGPLVDARGYLLGICSGVQNQHGYYTYIEEIYGALKREGYAWLYEDENPQPP
jgi:hypothetical protein